MRILAYVIVLVVGVTIWGGCAHVKMEPEPKAFKLNPITLNEPVKLRLNGPVGRLERTQYYSHSVIRQFHDDKELKAREEIVEFLMSGVLEKVDSQNETFSWKLTTLEKKGPVDLHDLAFPEKGEELSVVYKPNGHVVSAGSYPKDSVFYVPPVALPVGKVKVGDTWNMEARWVGLKNRLPLKMNLTTKFLGAYNCGGSGRCADLEITGDVELIGLDPTQVGFQSQVKGRMLFSIDKGTVIYSLVRSEETLADRISQITVDSCLASILIMPEKEAVSRTKLLKCDAKAEDFISPL